MGEERSVWWGCKGGEGASVFRRYVCVVMRLRLGAVEVEVWRNEVVVEAAAAAVRGGMRWGKRGAGSRRGAQVIEWLRLYGKSHLPPTPPLHLAHPPAPGFSVLPAASGESLGRCDRLGRHFPSPVAGTRGASH